MHVLTLKCMIFAFILKFLTTHMRYGYPWYLCAEDKVFGLFCKGKEEAQLQAVWENFAKIQCLRESFFLAALFATQVCRKWSILEIQFNIVRMTLHWLLVYNQNMAKICILNSAENSDDENDDGGDDDDFVGRHVLQTLKRFAGKRAKLTGSTSPPYLQKLTNSSPLTFAINTLYWLRLLPFLLL